MVNDEDRRHKPTAFDSYFYNFLWSESKGFVM